MIIPGLIAIIFVLIIIICILTSSKLVHQVNEDHNLFGDKIAIDMINGTRTLKQKNKNDILSRDLGYPTINVILDQPIPCGIYNAYSNFGKVSLFVGYNNRDVHCHFHEFKKLIDAQDRFTFYQLKKVTSNNNNFIITYNIGCKASC
jgi:hypothetical protein